MREPTVPPEAPPLVLSEAKVCTYAVGLHSGCQVSQVCCSPRLCSGCSDLQVALSYWWGRMWLCLGLKSCMLACWVSVHTHKLASIPILAGRPRRGCCFKLAAAVVDHGQGATGAGENSRTMRACARRL